jgi:hypothetical protein
VMALPPRYCCVECLHVAVLAVMVCILTAALAASCDFSSALSFSLLFPVLAAVGHHTWARSHLDRAAAVVLSLSLLLALTPRPKKDQRLLSAAAMRAPTGLAGLLTGPHASPDHWGVDTLTSTRESLQDVLCTTRSSVAWPDPGRTLGYNQATRGLYWNSELARLCH